MAESEIFHEGVNYISSREAADRVGLSHSYISKLCRRGLPGALLVDSSWFVDERDLRAYLSFRAEQRTKQLEQLAAKRKRDLVTYQTIREMPIRIAPITVHSKMPKTRSRIKRSSRFLPLIIASFVLVISASVGITTFIRSTSTTQYATASAPTETRTQLFEN